MHKKTHRPNTIATMAVLLTMSLSSVHAQTESRNFELQTRQAACLDSQGFTELLTEFKEIPYVRGIRHALVPNGTDSPMVVFVNPDTGTFTIAERAGSDTYCVIALGSGFHPVPRDLQDRARQSHDKSTL